MTNVEIQCITSHDHKKVFHGFLCFCRGNTLCQTYSKQNCVSIEILKRVQPSTLNGNLPFELWIPEWLKNGKDIDKPGGWAMESSWSSGRGSGFPMSQCSLGSTCGRSSSAKNDLRFKWDVRMRMRMRMSQQCPCILNKADGLLGYTEGDNGQEREGRCFPLLVVMSSTTDSCYMATGIHCNGMFCILSKWVKNKERIGKIMWYSTFKTLPCYR